MNLPASSQIQFTPDLQICRILNGMWQVSGAHGRINPKAAIESPVGWVESPKPNTTLLLGFGDSTQPTKKSLIKIEMLPIPKKIIDSLGLMQLYWCKYGKGQLIRA